MAIQPADGQRMSHSVRVDGQQKKLPINRINRRYTDEHASMCKCIKVQVENNLNFLTPYKNLHSTPDKRREVVAVSLHTYCKALCVRACVFVSVH